MGAEAAYREADDRGDAEGAMLLGQLLRRREELGGAAEAFGRAEARGHREAGSCVGNLLWDKGDLGAARAAYERSIAAGSSDAVVNLGLMLAQQGAADDALPYLRTADEAGDAGAAWAIGKLLENRGDYAGAAAAYRRSVDRGNSDATFAMARAETKAAVQAGAGRARTYAGACADVLAAANSCLAVANRAANARDVAGRRPQHEISIRNFLQLAEREEREFGPLYQHFVEVCGTARDAAAQLVGAQRDAMEVELVLLANVDEEALNTAATAKALLRARYGASPAAFIQGIEQANELMLEHTEGNIYRPEDRRTPP